MKKFTPDEEKKLSEIEVKMKAGVALTEEEKSFIHNMGEAFGGRLNMLLMYMLGASKAEVHQFLGNVGFKEHSERGGFWTSEFLPPTQGKQTYLSTVAAIAMLLQADLGQVRVHDHVPSMLVLDYLVSICGVDAERGEKTEDKPVERKIVQFATGKKPVNTGEFDSDSNSGGPTFH